MVSGKGVNLLFGKMFPKKYMKVKKLDREECVLRAHPPGSTIGDLQFNTSSIVLYTEGGKHHRNVNFMLNLDFAQ